MKTTEKTADSLITIKSKQLEVELIENGFTKAFLLFEEQIKELRIVYDTHFASATENEKYNLDSNADCTAEKKKLISDEIHRIVKPSIDRIFDNYEFIPAIFFIKKTSESNTSAVPMHQDPTLLINEREKKHIKIWCPLHDVDESNGAMFMVRGSHKFVPPVSAVTVPSHFLNVEEQLYSYLECIPLKVGEALIFDNRTIHYSSPNKTNNIRITAIISIVVSNSQFISLYKDPENKYAPIEVYFQDKDWYYHPLWKNDKERPLTGVKKGTLNYNVFQVTPQELSVAYHKKQPIKQYKHEIINEKTGSFWASLKFFLRA